MFHGSNDGLSTSVGAVQLLKGCSKITVSNFEWKQMACKRSAREGKILHKKPEMFMDFRLHALYVQIRSND